LTISDGHLRDRGDCFDEPTLGLSGGGIYNAGTLQLNRVVVSSNQAGNGGVCGFPDGGEGGSGGGVFNTVGATLSLIESAVNSNEAGVGGDNYTSVGGSSPGIGGSGGGIRNAGVIRMLNSAASGDGGNGGGIYNAGAGQLTLSNSTVAFNIAGVSPGGATVDLMVTEAESVPDHHRR
jgi:hypothetical protein